MRQSISIVFLSLLFSLSTTAQSWRCGICEKTKTTSTAPQPSLTGSRLQAYKVAPPTTSTEVTTIQYLQVYDQTGKRYAETMGGVEAHANKIVELTNNVFRNSGIAARFELVGTMVLEENMPTVDEALARAMSNEEVRHLRKTLKADIVSICSEPVNDGVSGVANLGSDAYSAYCSLRASAATGSYTAAHEIGHIFGCEHNREAPDGGTHAYAVGALRAPYFTVMSFPYGDDVTELVPIFSSPRSIWNGKVLGSETENCVRKIEERLAEVASFGESSRYQVSLTHWEAPNEGGEQRVALTVNTFYFINSDSPWLTVTPKNGYNNTTITLVAAPNIGGKARTAYVTIDGNDEYTPAKIRIDQAADPLLSVTALEQASPTYYIERGQLHVNHAKGYALRVFTLDGRLLFQAKVKEEATTYNLPAAHVVVHLVP